MSKDAEKTDEAPKKKGGFLKIAIFGVVLLGMGGGGTYAAFATGMLGGAVEEKEDKGPEYVLKGEEDPYAVKGEKDKGGKVVHGSGGSKYRTAYYEFEEDFTSNLAGGANLVQLSLAASTQKDGRVLMWLHDHELAIRSRILTELASTGIEDISSAQGKTKLQQRLADAINEELVAHEGFGGVDNVYFRSLIVQ